MGSERAFCYVCLPAWTLCRRVIYTVAPLCGSAGSQQALLVQAGELLLDDRTPQQFGVPNWRALVTYVPQARVQLKGTPSELYFTAQVRLAKHLPYL